MTINPFLHPIRAAKLAIRRSVLRGDMAASERAAEIPAALQPFSVGESLPLKGSWFKVGKIVGGDFPVIILVPAGATRGAKLQGLRNFRDAGRAEVKHARDVAKALAAEAR